MIGRNQSLLFISNPDWCGSLNQHGPSRKSGRHSEESFQRTAPPKTCLSSELPHEFLLIPEKHWFCIIRTHNWRMIDTSLPLFAKLRFCLYGCLSTDSAEISVKPWLQVMRSVTPKLQPNFLPLLRTGGHDVIGFLPRLSPRSSMEKPEGSEPCVSATPKPPL